MQHYNEIARLERNGFEIIVDRTYEDLDPRDHFEESDCDEICHKIDNGTYDWFMLRVRVMLDGHEFGSHYLGGCLYEWNKVNDVMTDGVAEDCINEALKEAKAEAVRLYNKLAYLPI